MKMREEKACRLDELEEGKARRVMVAGRALALVRIDGRVYACLDSCPHKGGYLSEGWVSQKRAEVICPWHRFRFHLESGRSVTNPELAVPTYPTRVADGSVLVEMP
jgi:nitrite reductase/ring-hydroxylating ferredoxin subunit